MTQEPLLAPVAAPQLLRRVRRKRAQDSGVGSFLTKRCSFTGAEGSASPAPATIASTGCRRTAAHPVQ